MSDLVERLRLGKWEYDSEAIALMDVEADEIERLKQLWQDAMRYRALRDNLAIRELADNILEFVLISNNSDIDAAADKLVEAMK